MNAELFTFIASIMKFLGWGSFLLGFLILPLSLIIFAIIESKSKPFNTHRYIKKSMIFGLAPFAVGILLLLLGSIVFAIFPYPLTP